MSLYLRDYLVDFASLPLPECNFEYSSLIKLAQDFHKSKEKRLKMEEWINLGFNHFGLLSHQAQVYYETFSTCIKNMDKITFLLLLFNQLSSVPFIRDKIHNGDEFPRQLSEFHHILSEISLNRDESEDDNQVRFPSHYISARKNLAHFWRSTGKQWLYLMHIYYYGDCETQNHTLSGLVLQDLAPLSNIFIAASVAKDSTDFPKIANRFSNWINLKNESDDEELALIEMDIVPLLRDLFGSLSTFKEKFTISVEKLSHWISYAVSVGPIGFGLLNVNHGWLTSIEQVGAASEKVLLTRKKSQTIILSEQLQGKTLYIHRCNDSFIYILGIPKNILISRCKNITVYAGIVEQTVTVRNCSNLNITAYCGRFLVEPLQGTSSTIHANISCRTRPLITSVVSMGDCQKIVFAPFNLWHGGILQDLKKVEHDLSKNNWNFPIFLWKTREITIQPVDEFLFFEVPFDRIDVAKSVENENCVSSENQEHNTDENQFSISNIELDNFTMTEEEAQLVSYLPDEYRDRILSIDAHITKLRAGLQKRARETKDLQIIIENNFNEWMNSSEKYNQLATLMSVNPK